MSTSATGEAECLCSGEATRVSTSEECGPRELRARAQRPRQSACMRVDEELEHVHADGASGDGKPEDKERNHAFLWLGGERNKR